MTAIDLTTLAPAAIELINPLVAGTVPNPSPSPAGLPNTNDLADLVGNFKWIALLIAGAIMAAGAILWFGASNASNPTRSAAGRWMTIGGALIGFVVGSAAVYIEFFYNAGAS